MTHDEILNIARERLAEIDREIARLHTQKAALAEERAKLAAMLGQSQPAPWTPPPLPEPVIVKRLPCNPKPWRLFLDDTWIATPPCVVGSTTHFAFRNSLAA